MKVLDLSPGCYRSGVIHARGRDWIESNCYIDVLLEIVHALDLEPRACLAFTVATDYEGDQWTFYKPPHGDLYDFYGIRIDELSIWRSLLEHAECAIDAGRLLLLEVDTYYLPDSRQTDYRRRHSKTTIALNAIEPESNTVEYFHNVGYFGLTGEDFRGLFRLDRSTSADWLPPYCEVLKLDDLKRLEELPLAEMCWSKLPRYLAMAPARNPIEVYGAQVTEQLSWLATQGEDVYHDYVFANLRQCGSCYEHTALMLDWLAEHDRAESADAAKAFREISSTAKMLVMKTARMAATGQVRDVSPQLDVMARAWEEGMDRLAGLAR
ncbi:MAG: DUF1839 family protein [Pseudomonadales bacterium]